MLSGLFFAKLSFLNSIYGRLGPLLVDLVKLCCPEARTSPVDEIT